MQISREHILISNFDSYCAEKGVAPSTVGKLVHNDTRLYDRLKKGGSCHPDTFEKVMHWFADNMPKKPRKKVRQ